MRVRGVSRQRPQRCHKHFDVGATTSGGITTKKPNSFSVGSSHAIFHIPRQEHQDLFHRFAQWLRPGGLLLFTVARYDDGPGYTEDDFFGGTMYWSNFGPSTYKKFLTETGFQIEQEGTVGGGSKSVNAPEEVHPFFFAVKREDL